MENYISIISIILIIIGYFIFLLQYIINNNQKTNNMTGFDLAKEITLDYNNINIIESNEITLSNYHLKRKVIRLTKKTYESNSLFTLTISAYLSCLSLINNKYINQLKRILPRIDYLNKSPIIMLILLYIINTITDAKIGTILGLIILIYQYYYLQITSECIAIAKEKKIIKKEIIKGLEKIYLSNKLFFISTLIILLKFIMIIIN